MPMSQISKSKLCTLEANYKSPNIVGVGHPNLNFWGVRTPTTPTVTAHLMNTNEP